MAPESTPAPGAPRVALVFCVHHKPWLIMSTLLSLLEQDRSDFDCFFILQEGDGRRIRRDRFKELYDEYYQLKPTGDANYHLDDYDPSIERFITTRLPRARILRYENDHSLDSGAWLKFIREGHWKPYDHVWFIGEGGVLTRPSSLSDLIAFAQKQGADFITAGHEKQRISKRGFLIDHFPKGPDGKLTRLDDFHQRMIQETFRIFGRDPAFERLVDEWQMDYPTETIRIVPDVFGPRGLWLKGWNLFYPNALHLEGRTDWIARTKLAVAKLAPLASQAALLGSRLRLRLAPGIPSWSLNRLYRDRVLIDRPEDVRLEREGQTHFLEEPVPEWFGCACTHFVSRRFLEKMTERFDRHSIWDVIDLPFNASAVEVIWGFLPIWLGLKKHFSDALHRVTKNFTNYRREDDPEGMARYFNRYYEGLAVMGWDRGRVYIQSRSGGLDRHRELLPDLYF